MKATVLIDNLASRGLAAEWGLSIHIDYHGHCILLDTGASEKFAENAQALGLDLGQVEFGVLSHAHYDHADGMAAFFAQNASAPFYLREGTAENCYGKRLVFYKYIGIHHGYLKEYKNRLRYVGDGALPLSGVSLLGHHTAGLARLGEQNQLYIRRGGHFLPDTFQHEQSLIFDTGQGLAVFSSCSHGGADNILWEVQQAYPGKAIRAMVGGFHLYHTPPEEIRALAKRLRAAGVEKIYTGHCTGGPGFEILKEELGGQAEQLYTGMEIEIPEPPSPSV